MLKNIQKVRDILRGHSSTDQLPNEKIKMKTADHKILVKIFHKTRASNILIFRTIFEKTLNCNKNFGLKFFQASTGSKVKFKNIHLPLKTF